MSTPNAHHRGKRIIQWTPAKLADAEVYVMLNAGRMKHRPCLGPDDVPKHDHFGTESDRICPRARSCWTADCGTYRRGCTRQVVR